MSPPGGTFSVKHEHAIGSALRATLAPPSHICSVVVETLSLVGLAQTAQS